MIHCRSTCERVKDPHPDVALVALFRCDDLDFLCSFRPPEVPPQLSRVLLGVAFDRRPRNVGRFGVWSYAIDRGRVRSQSWNETSSTVCTVYV